MPVRRLHNFVYCERLFYFQWVENIFEENADVAAGKNLHRNVDKVTRIKDEKADELQEAYGNKNIKSLFLESEKFGISGVIDLVELTDGTATIVDYKKGAPLTNSVGEKVPKSADAIQVIAYALLAKEVNIDVQSAEIYYAEEKRRVIVSLNEKAFSRCQELIAKAMEVAKKDIPPPPLSNDVRCDFCSAYPICLPNESNYWNKGEEVTTKIKVAPRPSSSDGEILILRNPKAKLAKRGGCFVVFLEGEKVSELPIMQTRGVYVYGTPQISTQALHQCFDSQISVSYFSLGGKFIGVSNGLNTTGVQARIGQYEIFKDTKKSIRLARESIRSKIHNQRVMLMRNGNPSKLDINELARLREKCLDVEDEKILLGLEGAAAKIYFSNFNSMMKGDVSSFDFIGRNRRPPRDPVNALLSMGYSMLSKELLGVCISVGLDPYLGFFHKPKFGRAALALDLMEEFRPLVADSNVISLINRKELNPGDFIKSSRGTFLKKEGLRTFWESYFRRLDTEVKHPEFGYKMSYRRMFEVQARQLWRVVRGEAKKYTGFTTR